MQRHSGNALARPHPSRARAGRLPGLLCAALLASLLPGACGERRAPDAEWPEGLLLSARAPALARLLAQMQSLEGTPLARYAAAVERARPDCASLEARVTNGRWSDLAEALDCAETHGPLAALHRARGDADLAFAIPTRDGTRVLGTGRGRDGHLALDLHWPAAPSEGAFALLLPGAESAGPALLGAPERVVHARVRPAGGLDVAALVAPDGQGDRLFKLRSDLLSGAVLDGTWEGAVYLPQPDHQMPRIALALGFRVRRAALAAAERLVSNLESTWPVHRSPIRVGDAAGTCLLDLNIMPEFSPCYVATQRALVVAWNPSSLRAALAQAETTSEPETPTRADPGRFVVELARLSEADARLAARAEPGPGGAIPSLSWPWRRLVARGRGTDEGVTLRLELEALQR